MGRLAIVEDEGPKVTEDGNESTSESNSPGPNKVRNQNNNSPQRQEMKKGTARKAAQGQGPAQGDDKRKAGNNSDESGFYEEEEPPISPAARDSIEIIYDKHEEDRTKVSSATNAINPLPGSGARVKTEERGEKSKNSVYQNNHKGKNRET